MISVTKLLFAREYYGDNLRYTKNALLGQSAYESIFKLSTYQNARHHFGASKYG